MDLSGSEANSSDLPSVPNSYEIDSREATKQYWAGSILSLSSNKTVVGVVTFVLGTLLLGIVLMIWGSLPWKFAGLVAICGPSYVIIRVVIEERPRFLSIKNHLEVGEYISGGFDDTGFWLQNAKYKRRSFPYGVYKVDRVRLGFVVLHPWRSDGPPGGIVSLHVFPRNRVAWYNSLPEPND